jgi:glutamate carboxypeptidase
MTGLSPADQAAVDRIDQAAMLARVEHWSAINSGTRNLAGVATMAGLLADAAAALPATIRLVAPTPVDALDADGRVDALAHGQHLHAVVRPQAPVQLLFTGHMDTVYGRDHPFQALRHRDDGTLNGPGVADMKGGLAVMLAALDAVEASPAAADLGYEIVINSDEETGSLSSASLLAEAARGKHAALTYEPALADGTLAGARGGTGNFSILVRGRSAHAGRNPDDGRNAIVAAADLVLRLAEARSPQLAVNPARIDGGGPNNVVPDLAVVRVNFRPANMDEIVRAQATSTSSSTVASIVHPSRSTRAPPGCSR